MEKIDSAFLAHAVNVLANTDNGLTGREICNYCSQNAFTYNISIPYSVVDKEFPKKSEALRKNLECFSAEQQFLIIKQLSQKEKFKDNEKVKELFLKLITEYSHLSPLALSSECLENVQQVRHWLDGYPEAKKHYESALDKKNIGIYERNMLDDLRLSFEMLLKSIFRNELSFENQKNKIGDLLAKKDISNEINNLINGTAFGFLKPYLNNNVKHNEKFNSIEVEFIFSQITSLMLFFIKLARCNNL